MSTCRVRVRSVGKAGILAAVLAAAGIGLPSAGAQQDSGEYRRRFIEEMQRKIPPLVVPQPSAAERAAPKAPPASNIDINEARALLGLTQSMTAARLPGGKLAIIDSGFKGIRERLDAVPAEKALTTIMRPGSGGNQPVADAAYAGPWESDHGYWVYRVVRAVAPDVPVLLYTASSLDEASSALLNAGTQGVVVSNMSRSFPAHFQIFNAEEDSVSKYLRVYMPQQEGFVFISSGNQRANVHSFVSADRNNNSLVDLHDAAAPGRDIDSLRIKARPGPDSGVFLTWDVSAHPDADYELQIAGKDGTVYYSGRVASNAKTKGFIYLTYRFSESVDGFIRVKRLAGPTSGVFMRIMAYPDGVFADFNGLQTTNAYLFRENPFTTYVGSFGRAAGGRLSPSPFSNIGTAPDGRLVPHVLGPGQLLIDGLKTDGTSFSSPFITALYATRVGYNFKNLIAKSSNFDRLAAGVAPHERSRWGIPDPALLARLDTLVGPTKVEDVAHAIEGDHLVLRFAVTRCCMEGLSWSIVASAIDAQSGQPVRGPDGAAVSGFASMRSEKADFARHPTEIRIPMAALASAKGSKIRMAFDIKVRRWPNPPPGTLKIDQAPVYDVTL